MQLAYTMFISIVSFMMKGKFGKTSKGLKILWKLLKVMRWLSANLLALSHLKIFAGVAKLLLLYNHYISAFTMLMVTRLIRVVIYQMELAPKSLHGPSMRWWCEVMWQIKYVKSVPAEGPHNKLEKVLQWQDPILNATWLSDHLTNVGSRNNLKNFCFYQGKAFSWHLLIQSQQ